MAAQLEVLSKQIRENAMLTVALFEHLGLKYREEKYVGTKCVFTDNRFDHEDCVKTRIVIVPSVGSSTPAKKVQGRK